MGGEHSQTDRIRFGEIGERLRAYRLGRGLTPELLATAGDAAARDAQPYAHNAFKVELTRRAVVRSLEIAGGLA